MGIRIVGRCSSCDRTTVLPDRINSWCNRCSIDPEHRKYVSKRQTITYSVWFSIMFVCWFGVLHYGIYQVGYLASGILSLIVSILFICMMKAI